MKNPRFRKWVLHLAVPAVALALTVASCAQQSESPVAPSLVRGGSFNEDPGPTPTGTPLPDPEPTATPTPTPTPTGIPCSPGYWKNHEAHFNSVCAAAAALPGDPFTTCDQLVAALTCKGDDASCGRSLAASALNTVSGCTED